MTMPKKLFAMTAMSAAFAFAQTKITTETQTTVTTETQRKVAVEVVKQTMETRRLALIVQNHAAHGTEIPMMALTDALTAKLSGRGFQVINPYNVLGVNQNRSTVGEKTPPTSALALARGVGAEGVLTASILDMLDTTLGTPPVLHQYAVRISINLADAGTGAAICGETIKMKSPKYTNNQVAQNSQEYLGDLLHAAAEECAARLEASPAVRAWRPATQPQPPATARDARSDRRPQPGILLMPPTPRTPATTLDSRVDVLIREMLANPQFAKNYGESKARQDGRLPVVVLGGLENKSSNASLDGLIEAAGEHFRVKLFNSKLFEVKDDGILVALAKRIVATGNSPLEDGELMGALKQHGSPDFFVAGDLKRLTDLDGIAYFKLRLAIHSLVSGKIVWEGIETFNRESEVAK